MTAGPTWLTRTLVATFVMSVALGEGTIIGVVLVFLLMGLVCGFWVAVD